MRIRPVYTHGHDLVETRCNIREPRPCRCRSRGLASGAPERVVIEGALLNPFTEGTVSVIPGT